MKNQCQVQKFPFELLVMGAQKTPQITAVAFGAFQKKEGTILSLKSQHTCHRIWRNQSRSDLEVSSLKTSFHSIRRSHASLQGERHL